MTEPSDFLLPRIYYAYVVLYIYIIPLGSALVEVWQGNIIIKQRMLKKILKVFVPESMSSYKAQLTVVKGDFITKVGIKNVDETSGGQFRIGT